MNRKAVIILLIVTAFLCMMPMIYAAKSLSQLEDDLAENRENIEQTKKEIRDKQTEKTELQKKKDEIDLEIATIQADIDDIQAVIDEKDIEIIKKTQEIVNTEETIKNTDGLLKKRMKVMIENGDTSYLEILLESDGISDFYTRMYIIDTIVAHDNNMINDFKNQKTTLEAAKGTLEVERAEQEDAKALLEEKKATIVVKQQEQQALIDEINGDINELKRQEQEMEEADRQIQAQIDAAMATSDHKDLTYTGSGKFILPLASYTRISDPYGLREKHPITGKRTMHNGIDYAAPSGTAIYAAEDGVVLTSGWINGYGYTITINHGSGYVTLYAHCSSLIAKAGDKVTQGQTIARVGSTGNSTGPHLHFEVKVNGVAKNPADYM